MCYPLSCTRGCERVGYFFAKLSCGHFWRMGQTGAGAACMLLQLLGFAPPALAAKTENSVRFAYEQVLNNADPYFNTSRLGIILADNVWDTLVYRDPET